MEHPHMAGSAGDLHDRAMRIFDLVCDLAPADRSELLRQHCGDDAALRDEVESMLDHDHSKGGIFENLERGAGIHTAVEELLAGDDQGIAEHGVIGRYQIIREIGRGGMGVIFEARQESPDRLVALKVLQRGLLGQTVLRRFERESQVLGKLQHSGIAQIYEAGVAEVDGVPRPFFAMELIEGEALDQYADSAALDARQRLELLARVCDAIQYANQSGVVHRDLKPSNVMVATPKTSETSASSTMGDALGQPKVLDFGIARVANPEIHASTIKTEVGQLVGTLAYMSPEQVAGTTEDLDARCDVYALGAIGYRLLTGKHAQPIHGLSVPEAARVIRDDEPAPLTTHDKRLSRDVTTIIAKAMEKDRSRRYETAGELAADIRRYLGDVPIIARPASTRYQLAKFARRNRGLVAGVCIAFMVLLLGAVGTSAGLIHALRSNAHLDEAVNNLKKANADLANVSTFQTEQLSGINAEVMGGGIRDAVMESVPMEIRAEVEASLSSVNFTDVALRTLEQNIFDRSLQTIESQFADTPLVRAALLQSVATTRAEVGLLESAIAPQADAIAIRESLLGEQHADFIASLRRHGHLAQLRGDLDGATAAQEQVLEWRRTHLGEYNEATLNSLAQIATLKRLSGDLAGAEERGREAHALATTHLGEQHAQTYDTSALVGACLLAQSRGDEAEPFLREAHAGYLRLLGADDERTLTTLEDLATLAAGLGNLDEAASLLDRTLEARRRKYGDDHPSTLSGQLILATILDAQGKPGEARALYQHVYERRLRTLGAEHPRTLVAGNNLATSLSSQGLHSDAEAVYRATLRAQQRVLGERHVDTLVTAANLGGVLNTQGRPEEAEVFYREAMEGMRDTLGDDSPYALQAIQNYGVLLVGMGRTDEAVPLYQMSLEGRLRVLGEDHPATLNAMYNMGDLLRRQGILEDAEQHCVAALEGYRKVGEDHIGTLYSLSNLGSLRVDQERYAEAELLFRDRYERCLRVFGADHSMTHGSIDFLADTLDVLGRTDDAALLRALRPQDGTD